MKTQWLFLLSLAVLLTACDNDNNRRAVNQAPSVGDVADLSISANQESAPISLALTDEDVNGLQLQVMSDRPNVIPVEGIAIEGAGSVRSIVLSPVADTLGDAFVTVIVTDSQGLSASTSFLVTLTPEQRSMTSFTRQVFDASESDEPALINAVEFLQDADDEDFSDLLSE